MMPTVWVLTSKYNDYDRRSENLICVFANKPTVTQLCEVVNINEVKAARILNNEGRFKDERCWYTLAEEDLK